MATYLHIINLDKFTKGFVSFIAKNFGTEDHAFIVHGKTCEHEFTLDGVDILRMNNYKEYKTDQRARQLIERSRMIIINGSFDSVFIFRYFPHSYLSKVYFMFWGADLYSMKNRIPLYDYKNWLKAAYKKKVIRNAGGVINLIDGDYDALCEIVTPKGKHFVAPMCDDGSNFRKKQEFFSVEKSKDPIKILVGNSATPTNQHIEVFNMLDKYKNENIEIICPLSYGDKTYAKSVISEGKRIFGSKFTPITDYMNLEEYYRIISLATVAVFNNNRQQALGNILALLAFKCKVFLKNDTSMWEHFAVDHKFIVFDISSIANTNFNQFISISATDAEYNRELCVNMAEPTARIEAWRAVFNNCI